MKFAVGDKVYIKGSKEVTIKRIDGEYIWATFTDSCGKRITQKYHNRNIRAKRSEKAIEEELALQKELEKQQEILSNLKDKLKK